MKVSHLFALALLATASLHAQTKTPQGITPQPNQTDSSLTAETRHAFQAISVNVLKAAREMPESSYGFSPVEGVRNFGALVSHIANVQGTLCGDINGHAVKPGTHQPSKDVAVKELADSIGECQTAFEELSAENASKMVKTPAGELTHLAALVYILTHASEEYGQMAIYLRLNHLQPPTSDDATGGSTGKAKT